MHTEGLPGQQAGAHTVVTLGLLSRPWGPLGKALALRLGVGWRGVGSNLLGLGDKSEVQGGGEGGGKDRTELPPTHTPLPLPNVSAPGWKVWGFIPPGDQRLTSVPPTRGPNTFLLLGLPRLPPHPAPPQPASGPMETRRTDGVLLLALLLSQPCHTTEVTQRRQGPRPHPGHPWRGELHPRA